MRLKIWKLLKIWKIMIDDENQKKIWNQKNYVNLINSENVRNQKSSEILEDFWKSEKKEFWGLSCREIVEQDLTLKIQKVGQKAKRPQNKKNVPTHPMTMPLKRLGKKSLGYIVSCFEQTQYVCQAYILGIFKKLKARKIQPPKKNSTKRGSLLPKFQSEHVHMWVKWARCV